MNSLPFPAIQYDPKTQLWKLTETFEVHTALGMVRIMPGFEFDGCSIPRLLWRMVGHPLQGNQLPGGTIHDGLYASHLCTRAEADAVFRSLLIRYGANRFKGWLMWRTLRAFGWVAYRRTDKQIEAARKFVHLHSEVREGKQGGLHG